MPEEEPLAEPLAFGPAAEEERLPPGILRTGLVTGPLTQRASISPVREFASWRFTIVAHASAAQLQLSRLRCSNVPIGHSMGMPYLRCRLLNEGCKNVRDATSVRANSANPSFSEVLSLPLPAGLKPTVQMELWSHAMGREDELLAYAQLHLQNAASPLYVERMRLNLKAGIMPHPRGALSCNFEYVILPSEGHSPDFFHVQLDPPQPAKPIFVVWQESVMRELSRSNDVDRGIGPLQPIHVAASMGLQEDVAALLKQSVFIEKRAKCKWTPLMFAIRSGYPHVVEQLLSAGADVNARDIRGSTPLHRAAYGSVQPQHDASMIQLLLAHHAVIDARDDARRTPLHVAADNGNLSAARALIAQGADQWAKDNDGKSPPDLAREAGRHGHLEAPAILALFEHTKPTAWRHKGGGAVKMVPRCEMEAVLEDRRLRASMRPPARGGP